MQPEEPSASSSAAALIASLPEPEQYGFGGLCAALLGRSTRTRRWDDPWCRQHLQRLASRFLCLEPHRCDALFPLFEATALSAQDESSMINAFVSLLPKGEHERAALLLGLLVLTVTSEDAQLVGYDARARQLLADLAHALSVPWPRLAAMERELAISMKKQANERLAARETTTADSPRQRPVDSAPPPPLTTPPPQSARGEPSSARSSTSGAHASANATSDNNNGESGASTPRSGSGMFSGMSSKWKKRLAVAGVGVGSGIVIGLTAGLAAPLVVAGLGTVGAGITGLGGAAVGVGGVVTGISAMLSGAVGVTVVTTVFGATGAGLASYKMDRRLGDVKEFEFAQPPSGGGEEEGASSEAAAADTGTGGGGAAQAAQADGLVVCVCVSGWLVGDGDSPQSHWWGKEEEDEDENEEGEKEGKGASPPSQRAYYWPHPPPATAEPPAAAAAPVPSSSSSALALDPARAERAAWLIEMGFPADASRRVAARFESTETMVEHLLASGITPSIDAATATANNDGGSGSSSTEAASAPVTLEPVALDEPILDEEVPTLEQPMSNLTLVSEAEHPLANGGEGSPSGAAAEAHKMSATAVLASFVEVDAPKRSALECIPYAEHHVLLWEGRELRVLGNALTRIAASEALAVVASQTLKHTFLSALMSALAPPAYLIKACDVLDNPWAVAFSRAQKAGVLLAQVLLERAHGARPVILVGFGLGARLLYEAALHLASQLEGGDGRAAGVIQHLVLMGLPATCERKTWLRIRRVVAGRVVNAFRPTDLVLAMVHRASNLALGVAGLSEVKCDGVENYDVSAVVAAHHKYRHHTSDVLTLIGLEEPL